VTDNVESTGFLVETYAGFISKTEFFDLSEDAVSESKRAILDCLAAYFAGLRHGPATPVVQAFAKYAQWPGDITLWGAADTVAPLLAVFCNAAISHSIELDDGYRYGTAHPGTVIVPAALAAAEMGGANGRQLIASTVLGYEILSRLAAAINLSHWHRGYHTTSTCGSLGAAAAASKALSLGYDVTSNALAISGLMGFGLQEMLFGGQMSKAFQVGRSAQGGVMAVILACQGGEGPMSLFEGKKGWFQAVTDAVSEDWLLQGLGKHWEITRRYVKLYPTCRHVHSPIALSIEQAVASPEEAVEIESIHVGTYSVAVAETAQIVQPSSLQEGMFSIPYCVAVALVHGKVTVEDLDSSMHDPVVADLASKVQVDVDDEWDALSPHSRGAHLEIRYHNGRVVKSSTPLQRGEPENPISATELEDKFMSYGSKCLPLATCKEIISTVDDLENVTNIRQLTALLKGNISSTGRARYSGYTQSDPNRRETAAMVTEEVKVDDEQPQTSREHRNARVQW
jgi:2-methylcitrate dehydratase PrpD